MGKVGLALSVLVLMLLVAGSVAVMTLDLPAPTEPVEKVIPNDRVLD
jgi:hypothetical protein